MEKNSFNHTIYNIEIILKCNLIQLNIKIVFIWVHLNLKFFVYDIFDIKAKFFMSEINSICFKSLLNI